MQYGFIGLGQMGKPMALNLGKSCDVLAFDPRPGIIQNGGRAQQVQALAQLAQCDAIILCLPNEDVIRGVLFTDGFAQTLRAGTAVIDTSTINYNAALDIGARLDDLGLPFLDAPVSGMQKRAEDATLTMMVGGDADLLARHKPALDSMANNILHMGPRGAGQLTKLVNQLLFDVNMAALAEIMPMSAKLGLDPEKMAAVVNSGTGRSFASEFFLPNILQGVFDQGYPMGHAYKDLVSGAELGARQGIPMPVLAAATATYQRALAEGLGAQDKGAMIKVFETLLGTEFRAGHTE